MLVDGRKAGGSSMGRARHGAEDDAPKEGGSGGKEAGDFLGLKPAGAKPSASESKEQKASGAEKRWGVGDRAPKPEDPSKPKEPEKPKPKAEIAIKPLFQAQYGEGAWASTQEGADDKTFVTALAGKASAEAIGGSFDVKAKKGKLTLFKAKAEGTLVHGQIDLVEAIGNFLFGKKPTPPAPPSGPLTPMAARVLDLTAHGVPFVPGPGSTNVFWIALSSYELKQAGGTRMEAWARGAGGDPAFEFAFPGTWLREPVADTPQGISAVDVRLPGEDDQLMAYFQVRAELLTQGQSVSLVSLEQSMQTRLVSSGFQASEPATPLTEADDSRAVAVKGWLGGYVGSGTC